MPKKQFSIGFDIGSSSVKASLLNLENSKVETSDFFPKKEMPIIAKKKRLGRTKSRALVEKSNKILESNCIKY